MKRGTKRRWRKIQHAFRKKVENNVIIPMAVKTKLRVDPGLMVYAATVNVIGL